MSLDCLGVHRDYLVEGVEGDIPGVSVWPIGLYLRTVHSPNIIIPVRQKLSQDIDSHDPQSAIRLDIQNSQDCLVQDRVSYVLTRIGIGSNLRKISFQPPLSEIPLTHLRQDIIHLLTRSCIPLTKQPQQPQNLDLQERIRDAAYIMLR